ARAGSIVITPPIHNAARSEKPVSAPWRNPPASARYTQAPAFQVVIPSRNPLSESPVRMSEQTFSLLQAIRDRLRAATRRITLAELTFGLVLTVGILSAVWVASVAVEAGFWLEKTPRAVLFWTLALVAAGLFGYFLLLPAL